MFTNQRRIWRSGLINFLRGGLVSFSSVVVLTTTLFIVGWLVIGQGFFTASLTAIQDRVDISISFIPEAREEQVLGLKQKLEALPEVVEVTYSSRDDELADFRERNKDIPIIMRSLDEIPNPLGARLKVKATDPVYYDSISRFLDQDTALSSAGERIIFDTNYRKTDIDQLTAFISSTRQFGSAIALVLIFISIITVFGTVSLAIHISREEIGVMRLVGADNRYIRGPFIVEGVIAGLISSVLALLVLYPSVIWARRVTTSFVDQFDFLNYYLSSLPVLFLIIALVGAGLSILASLWAVRKYLKV